VAEWEPANVEDFVPSEIKDLADSMADLISPIADIYDKAADAVELAADFMIVYVDPIRALVQTFVEEVVNFLGDLRTAGVYVLPVAPLNTSDRIGMEGLIKAVSTSFDDLADADRPQFSESAELVGYVILVGSDDISTLYDLFLKQSATLFDFGEFKDWEWAEDPDYVPPRVIRSANAKPPDWKNVTVAEVCPPIGEGLRELERSAEALYPGDALNDFIDALAEVMRNKSLILQALADRLEEIAQALEDFFKLDVWYLKVGPIIGQNSWREEFLNATNRPPYEEGVDYVSGLAFLGGGPSVVALERLFG